jgi:hypothetical protein
VSRLTRAANKTAGALHNAGVKVAGRAGAKAAAVISNALLGRHFEECSDACGWCDEAADPNNPPRP